MKILYEEKIEFIAKTVTDLGKAIFVVGLASYFFKEFPFFWRFAITILSIIFIFSGVIIYPIKRGEE